MAAVLFKVALLTLKTAAKPLAKQFEKLVMSHPVMRKQVIGVAQRLHRLDVGINRGAEGKGGRVFVADMTEDKAVELASKVVSEGFLYGMGVVLVVVELNRKNKDDIVKKEKEAAEKQEIKELHERHLSTEKEIREQMRTLAKQLHQFDERLQYMEQAMGRKRSWLPLFGG